MKGKHGVHLLLILGEAVENAASRCRVKETHRTGDDLWWSDRCVNFNMLMRRKHGYLRHEVQGSKIREYMGGGGQPLHFTLLNIVLWNLEAAFNVTPEKKKQWMMVRITVATTMMP